MSDDFALATLVETAHITRFQGILLMGHGWRVSAMYASGFEYVENDADLSVYVVGKNCWHDIVEGLPCPVHGPLVQLSLIGDLIRYDFDLQDLPESTVPVHEMRMEAMLIQGGPQDGTETLTCRLHRVGYSFVDEYGSTVSHIVEIPSGDSVVSSNGTAPVG